jgi:putative oxidoreductase
MHVDVVNVLVAAGQALLGALYVYGGLNHFGPASQKIIPVLAARGVPMPREALYLASTLQVIGGACLMVGAAVLPAALGLALFTVVASVVMLNFWDMPEGEPRELLQSIFISNGALVGGLLLAAAGAM